MLHSLADRFEAVAARQPSGVAMSAGPVQVTYAAAAALARRVASRLTTEGIGPGDRVVLFCGQPAAAIGGFFGMLRVGAIAVPLAPTHPNARRRQALRDSAARAILTDSAHLEEAGTLVVPGVVAINVDALEDGADPASCDVDDSTPALILYTSGSSGQPKGVVQTHRNLLQKIDACADVFRTTPDDRFAMLSSMAVGRGVITLLSALLHGAVLCPFDVPRGGLPALGEWLADERISILFAGSTLFRTLASSFERADRRLRHLRLVRLGGEQVTPADVAEHRRLFGHSAELLVSYSTTETGPTCYHAIGSDETFADGIVPVGRALPGVSVAVVDESGADVPEGEAGEVLVRSAYMSPGYWGDPARTAERLTASSHGERLFRTGDAGRLRGGLLEYHGRLDDRVKIRGYRVELGEIEAALGRCPDVLHAAVVARQEPAGEARVVAYVQPRRNAHPTVDTLRADLAAALPGYAIPAAFVIVDSLPLTESGKPDRLHLPEPSLDRPTLSSPWVAPRTPLEETVAEVWREVLGLERIGVHDEFLALGGDSLKATRVAARLSSVLRVDLPMAYLLDASTVEAVAEVLKRLGKAEG